MQSKVILGSGLVALICRKILGSDWKIIPIGPSRFYAQGVPALGDDFVIYDDSTADLVRSWNVSNQNIPILYKRPLSISGELLYNNTFIEGYLEKIGVEPTTQAIDYYKSDFTVFPFSCVQLHKKLLAEFIDEIRGFYPQHKGAKKIAAINDHEIIIDNGDRIEYDQMISTIPYEALAQMLNIPAPKCYADSFFYLIRDDNIDLEGADQALVEDLTIPFHKCTKINKNTYLLESLEYHEDIYNALNPVLGSAFDILDAKIVKNCHVVNGPINIPVLEQNGIICVGSHAQCDHMIDIGSVIKRVLNLLKRRSVD